MDTLAIYKQAWQNQPKDSQKISREEIFKMMQTRSSSIVKWIFIIGLLEFILLGFSFLLFDVNEEEKKVLEQLKEYGFPNLITFITIFYYGVILYFLFQFYSNYKKITTVDNTKKLMLNILKTRKTVKVYILFNLIIHAIFISLALTLVFLHGYNQAAANDFSIHITSTNLVYIILTLVIISIISVFIIWFFYQLLYGILLKKLYKNYKELIKLEELK